MFALCRTVKKFGVEQILCVLCALCGEKSCTAKSTMNMKETTNLYELNEL